MTQELPPPPLCDHGNRDESGMIDVAGRAHYHWRCRDCGEEGHNISAERKR